MHQSLPSQHAVNLLQISLPALLFVSIVPYGSEHPWFEGLSLAGIFIAAAYLSFKNIRADRLLTPILILATFAFLQGIIAIVVNLGFAGRSFLPVSFDSTASIWVAVKFLGFAVAVRLFGSVFSSNIKHLVWSLIGIGGFFGAFGLIRYAIQIQTPEAKIAFLLPDLFPGIGFGTIFNQNHYAFLMTMTLGLVTSLVIYGKLASGLRLVLLVTFLVCWSSLVLTGSRAAIMSSLIVAAAAIIFPAPKRGRPPQRKLMLIGRFAAAAMVLGLLVAGIILIGQDRVVSRFERISAHMESSDTSQSFSRPDVWKASGEMFTEHPVFGVGFGAFRTAVPGFIDVSGATIPEAAHNEYLEIAAVGGIVGIVLFCWFLARLVRTIQCASHSGQSRYMSAARFGALYAFAGIAFHSLFEYGMHLLGVWLFAAAVLAVAVHNHSPRDEAEIDTAVIPASRFMTLLYVSFLGLATFCILFATVRFQQDRLTKGSGGPIFSEFLWLPFDADSYAAEAQFLSGRGEHSRAAEQLWSAVRLRPDDHSLWLSLAAEKARSSPRSNPEPAYIRAIDLAPRFARPYFEYGKFLIDSGRTSEGFDQLRTARRRDPSLFENVLQLAWGSSGQEPLAMINILAPLNSAEADAVAEFLFERGHFEETAMFACGSGDLSHEFRSGLIAKFLEIRRYRDAFIIRATNCDSPFDDASLASGDFERDEIRVGDPFGWKVIRRSEYVRPEIDVSTASNGTRSVKFTFAGSAGFDDLLSHTQIVDSGARYQFSLAFMSKNIVTGGPPVFRVVAKGPDHEMLISEIVLSGPDGKWSRKSVSLTIDSQTEAVEISVGRKPCPDPRCPIFGELWIDEVRADRQP